MPELDGPNELATLHETPFGELVELEGRPVDAVPENWNQLIGGPVHDLGAVHTAKVARMRADDD